MRALLPVLCLAALGGCANVEQLRAQAPYQTDFEVCRAMVMGTGPIVQVARDEGSRRNVDCNPHLATIGAMQNQQAQQVNSGLTLLQMSQPRPVQPLLMPPQSVNCVSRPSVGSVYTTCN